MIPRRSEHWRFTSSLPREWALARPRAKVGPWRVVEGVTALLRRNGLAEQAGEEVESPKSRRRAAGCTAPKKQAQGSRLHGAQPWAPLSHENTARPSPKGRNSKGRVGGSDKTPQGEGNGTLGADANVLKGLEVGRDDVRPPFLRH